MNDERRMRNDMRRNIRGSGRGYYRRDRGIEYDDYNMRRESEYNSRMDGHHYPNYHHTSRTNYYPIEAMGSFNGYYGMPEQDYRYERRDMNYNMPPDMRGRDYGYDMRRMDYAYYGDYGETLTDKELEEWCYKLKSQLDDREKQIFSKEIILQKARQMNIPVEKFGEKEFEVTTLMVYTDYKETIGQNIETAIRLAHDWLNDKDARVKGAEKLAVYYDDIVDGE